MIKLSKDNTKRQLAIHGWTGLVLGFLLYIVVFTGAVVVFENELEQWSASHLQTSEVIDSSVTDLVNHLAKNTAQELWQDIDIHKHHGELEVFFHEHRLNKKGQKQPYGVQYSINLNTINNPKTTLRKQIIQNRQIGFPANFEDPSGTEWVQFMRFMHTNLYIPGRLGFYATGIIGLLLLVSAVSGFLLHRHLIKDMFLSPRKPKNKTGKTINYRDGHNLAATWTLPYAFVLAFTGAFLSFALTLGLPTIAYTAFKGDINTAMEKVSGKPSVALASEVSHSNQLLNLDNIIIESQKRIDSYPNQINIRGYGSEQSVVITRHFAGYIDKDFMTNELMFDGNTGEFIQELSIVGQKPTISSDTLQLMFSLHFGNFSGWLSKLLWFGLGLLLCYVVITGFKLWFERRIKQASWRRLYFSVPIISYGVPISFLSAGLGFFFCYTSAINISMETSIWLGFGLGWLLSLASLIFVYQMNTNNSLDNTSIKVETQSTLSMTHIKNNTQSIDIRLNKSMQYINQYFRFVLAFFLLLLPIIRWQSSHIGWLTLAKNYTPSIIVIDLFFIIAGLIFYHRFLTKK
ncbi:PepSY-associated TM helix domain-containing protein [Psychrobacter sp. HD31]|uniref:PepSY-associated TM helix domain-containing protein n=1 Tax=Psychrobacter sp. HD31 TaxID=3112003 RepID=UPI003DA647D4